MLNNDCFHFLLNPFIYFFYILFLSLIIHLIEEYLHHFYKFIQIIELDFHFDGFFHFSRFPVHDKHFPRGKEKRNEETINNSRKVKEIKKNGFESDTPVECFDFFANNICYERYGFVVA